MKHRIFLAILVLISNCTFIVAINSNHANIIPQRIVLNLTADPSSSIAVTWRTNAKVKYPGAQIVEATDWIDMKFDAKNVNANTEKINLDSNIYVYHHSTIFYELKPNTLYAYRVGGDSIWSEWNQFSTAKNETAPFDFVFIGDPQNGIKDFVTRLFRQSLLMAPTADFWLFTGDLMNLPQYDKQWDEWFYASGFIPSIVPSIMTPGSHEYAFKNGDSVRYDIFTPLWDAHFTLPENGIKDMEERSFYVDYQGVRFIMLDSQILLNEQAEWLNRILADNPNKWTIAAMHEPLYSAASHRDGRRTRDAFLPLFDKYSVDLVLTGHDHLYSRSKKLFNGNVLNNDENGTVYVVSSSGSKAYKMGSQYNELMEKTGEKMHLFQVISFEENKLIYKSYTVTGNLNDSFELMKN